MRYFFLSRRAVSRCNLPVPLRFPLQPCKAHLRLLSALLFRAYFSSSFPQLLLLEILRSFGRLDRPELPRGRGATESARSGVRPSVHRCAFLTSAPLRPLSLCGVSSCMRPRSLLLLLPLARPCPRFPSSLPFLLPTLSPTVSALCRPRASRRPWRQLGPSRCSLLRRAICSARGDWSRPRQARPSADAPSLFRFSSPS